MLDSGRFNRICDQATQYPHARFRRFYCSKKLLAVGGPTRYLFEVGTRTPLATCALPVGVNYLLTYLLTEVGTRPRRMPVSQTMQV